jgi:hypothetical protein
MAEDRFSYRQDPFSGQSARQLIEPDERRTGAMNPTGSLPAVPTCNFKMDSVLADRSGEETSEESLTQPSVGQPVQSIVELVFPEIPKPGGLAQTIPHALLSNIVAPPLTLVHPRDEFPDRLSREELVIGSAYLARHFRDLGMDKGDRVLFALPTERRSSFR